MIAERAGIVGSGCAPASLVEADGLIPPELVEDLARSATLVPLVHPGMLRPSRDTPRRRRWPILCAAGI
ncbi:putative HNH endonuclease domain protein [Mycobacterium xenopi 4042]|uniref:Putative HNH endonuclease domain protein n=1 Tax=Mycobacterium xenopi 4042 TaxID=1299334 RepID=X8AGM5_MYCXE|nr:putative HNH endonuclease domain protein [Mycobacterium xenopi 4042]